MTARQRAQFHWWTNASPGLIFDWQGPFRTLDEALEPSRVRWGPVFVACRGTTLEKIDRVNAVVIDLSDARARELRRKYSV